MSNPRLGLRTDKNFSEEGGILWNVIAEGLCCSCQVPSSERLAYEARAVGGRPCQKGGFGLKPNHFEKWFLSCLMGK